MISLTQSFNLKYFYYSKGHAYIPDQTIEMIYIISKQDWQQQQQQRIIVVAVVTKQGELTTRC